MNKMSELLDEVHQHFEEIEKWGLAKAEEYHTAKVIPFILLEGTLGRYIDKAYEVKSK